MAITNRVKVTNTSYTDVSKGDLNCMVAFQVGKRFRVAVINKAPKLDDVDFVPVAPGGGQRSGLAVTFNNIATADRVWVLSEDASGDVFVIRGPQLTVNGF